MSERPPPDAGFALPAMLALLALMALVVGSIVEVSRSAHDRGAAIEARTLGYYAAEAGIADGADAIAEAVVRGDPAPHHLSTSVNGFEVESRVSPEAARVDVNLAPLQDVRQALSSAGGSNAVVERLMASITQRRSAGVIRSISAFSDDRSATACLDQVLTLHGGAIAISQDERRVAALGEAYRIRATARRPAGAAFTVTAIVRLTGDPARPLLVHTWRREVAPAALAEQTLCLQAVT
jgi:Tfp pilus assembly protein PilX